MRIQADMQAGPGLHLLLASVLLSLPLAMASSGIPHSAANASSAASILGADVAGPHGPVRFLLQDEGQADQTLSFMWILVISTCAPGSVLLCFIYAQLRRWLQIRKMNRYLRDSAAQVEPWSRKAHRLSTRRSSTLETGLDMLHSLGYGIKTKGQVLAAAVSAQLSPARRGSIENLESSLLRSRELYESTVMPDKTPHPQVNVVPPPHLPQLTSLGELQIGANDGPHGDEDEPSPASSGDSPIGSSKTHAHSSSGRPPSFPRSGARGAATAAKNTLPRVRSSASLASGSPGPFAPPRSYRAPSPRARPHTPDGQQGVNSLSREVTLQIHNALGPPRELSTLSEQPPNQGSAPPSTLPDTGMFDDETMSTLAALPRHAPLETQSDAELSRRLSLFKRRRGAEDPHSKLAQLHAQAGEGYSSQVDVVRYSRLLKRDALVWLDDPDSDCMAFYETKQRGVIKLQVVVTMYAETPDLVERSLRGIAHGINMLATETDFLRSWDEAIVVIVADGLAKLPKETAEWFEMMGVYAPSLIDDAKKIDAALEGDAPEVALHCFEGLMQFEDWCPLQTMLVVKQDNAGKLDSQRWAFTGLAERLMPTMPEKFRKGATSDREEKQSSIRNITVNEVRSMDRFLLTVDAGTQPKGNSLFELIKPMRFDPSIAGTCGHMIPDKTAGNPLVMSQVFEYEYGHIMDKAMESIFGFITVLPGAYSAYRYDCIRRDQWIKGRYRREGPLVGYFEPLTTPTDSPALLNMGLAEDRWLCFELMACANRSNSLWYAKRATAVTDVPDTLQSLLQQRRRWNNGAFFTRLYTIRNSFRILQGNGHSIIKRIAFLVQLLTMVFDLVVTWFATSLFYLWIAYNVTQLSFEYVDEAMGPAFLILYLLAIVAHYDRRVPDIKYVHMGIATILGLMMYFCIGSFIYDQVLTPDWMVIFLVSGGVSTTLLCSLLQGKFIKILAMMPAYFLMYPTYAVLGQLYGFCHVHDVSWGTKGIESVQSAATKEREEAMRAGLSRFRFRILVSFLLSNFFAGYIISWLNESQNILLPMLYILVGFSVIRALGSVAFTVVHWLDDCLQLTAIPHSSRDFGPEYDRLNAAVRDVNSADIRAHHKVYKEVRTRCENNQWAREQELQARVPRIVEAEDFDNLYELNSLPPSRAGSVAPSRRSSLWR